MKNGCKVEIVDALGKCEGLGALVKDVSRQIEAQRIQRHDFRYRGTKKDEPSYQEMKTLNDLAHAELLVICESDLCFGIIENEQR